MQSIESTDTALRLAIVRRAFSVRRRGYDMGEVDELLDSVSRLADDLLTEVDATSRNLAEAEAELICARAEVRELRDVAAAADHLLASTRAELRAERNASARDEEADEKLVVAEAELRMMRAAADHADEALVEARELLSLERAARGTVEAQLADMTVQLDAANAQISTLLAEQARDVFAEVADEIAEVLRAAATTADDIRRQARQQADVLLAEAEELANAVLVEAEAKTVEAEARAGADAVLEQAGEVLDDHDALAPFAMESNGGDE